MNPTKKTTSKKGGSITEDAAKLAVPFGIMLAKKALENHIKSKKNNKVLIVKQLLKSPPKKTVPKSLKTQTVKKEAQKQSVRKRAIVGGGSCTKDLK